MPQSRRHDKRDHSEIKHGRLAIFPACALNDARLSLQQVSVLAALSTHSSRSGYVEVAQDALAARLGVTREYVNRTLSYLERLGYARSARRKRSSDGGEATKLYRLELDYALPVEHWRYIPTDYGSEPDEITLDALFPSRPPVTVQSHPPVTVQSHPCDYTVTPSYLSSSSSSSNNTALPRADDDEAQSVQTEAEAPTTPTTPTTTPNAANHAAALERLRAAARLSPTTNVDALAAMVARYLALGMTQDDMVIALSACAEWYAANRSSAPLLSNVNDWLQREVNQRAKLERAAARQRALEEATDYATANATNAANAANDHASAVTGEPTASRPTRATSRSGSHQSQTRRRSSRATNTGSGQCTGDESDWRPGSRAYVYDEPTDTWTIITETGERIPWRADDEEAQAKPDGGSATA